MSSGAPGFAWKNVFQFGRESTWGVDTPATKRLKTYSIDIDPAHDVVDPEDLSDGSLFRQEMLDGPKGPTTIDIEIPLTYTGILLLWDCAFGTTAYGVTGGSTGAGPPYTHTFLIREFLNSLVLECALGNIPANAIYQMLGCKISRISASASGQRNDGRLRISLLGKTWQSSVSPTNSLTAPTLDIVMFKHLNQSTFNDGLAGAGVGGIRGFEFTVDNRIGRRDLGDQYSAEFLRNGRPQVTLSIDREFQDKLALDAHYNLTQGAPKLEFASGTKGFTINMPKAYLKDAPSQSRDGMGMMSERLVWTPIGDDGTPETYTTVTFTNSESSIT